MFSITDIKDGSLSSYHRNDVIGFMFLLYTDWSQERLYSYDVAILNDLSVFLTPEPRELAFVKFMQIHWTANLNRIMKYFYKISDFSCWIVLIRLFLYHDFHRVRNLHSFTCLSFQYFFLSAFYRVLYWRYWRHFQFYSHFCDQTTRIVYIHAKICF